MFTKTLLPDTLRAIKLVASNSYIKQAYLAGGTALALHLGHRISVDLDFFIQRRIDENLVAADLAKIPEFQKNELASQSVLGKISQTKFSIFSYPYNQIDVLHTFETIHIASKKDIAAMKIHAISDRGAKRDFIDMFFLTKEFTLEQIFDFYNQKYGNIEEKSYILIKGLLYFDDAEDDEMPNMLIPIDWEEVKAFFRKEVKRLSKKFLIKTK